VGAAGHNGGLPVRRFERRRVERTRRLVIAAGLSFALGALADRGLEWRLGGLDASADQERASAKAAPAHDPAEPRGAERPREDEPSAAATVGIQEGSEIEALRARDLELPVDGVDDDDLRDTFSDARGQGRAHEAIDIMAPRGTPVRAVEDGTIAKLFNSRGGGGLSVYQFDPAQIFTYYYAHLDSYGPGLSEGQLVRRGQTIGYVGSTGNASPDAPHLHFAIFRLTPERKWWKGEPINPYRVFD
jgi:peptidoglycan LD-endopeptidase LytH